MMEDDQGQRVKHAWQTPVLTDLDLDMRSVENGLRPGDDGASTQHTSLS